MKMSPRSKNPVSVGGALEDQDLAGEQRGLLDLTDQLQFAQLDNVKLPRIVVVGDQSAGKSSVLEAITGTPFPRHADGCTRFATEIRLRRAAEEKLTVRIIPDTNIRAHEEQKRLQRFGATVDESMDFSTLMMQAADQIAPKNVPGRFVAEDILVVEKVGPKMPLLTVVDMPELVRNANKDQTLDDINAINDLTDHYMKSSRTINLVVVGGNQDYVQAPVLTKARHFDPAGGRTIGVLTKPDLTESIGLEDKFIRLVCNEDKLNNFDLGWFVLLNPGPRKDGEEWPTGEERKQAEDDFFSKGKWSTLQPAMCGAAALKQKLSMQLQRHIGKHVRTLQKEIQKAHNDCEAELKTLGTGKDTVEEMRKDLAQLCYDSEKLVTQAVQGTNRNPPGTAFFPPNWDRKGIPPQNLRARAVDENSRFAERVRTHGQKPSFSSGSDPNKPGSVSKKEFARKEVEPLLRQNVGTEFPLDYSSRLVYKLFQRHSENWAELAQEHRNNILITVSEFLAEIIDYIWPPRMREPLRTHFLDPQMKKISKKAQKQVGLLRTDLEFEVRPYDPQYEDFIKNWRSDILMEKSDTGAEELLEKMLVYYELTAKTFINNVITQVVERHLLHGVDGIFSYLTISEMDEQTVLDIAAEDKATRDRRMALKAKRAAIEEAADRCAALAMRKELRIYGRFVSGSPNDSSDDDEMTTAPHRTKQEHTISKSHGAGSSPGTPLTPRIQPLRVEQAQSTSNNNPFTTNRSSGQRQTTQANDPFVPGGWDTDLPANHNSTAANDPPKLAPSPAPPRPEKVLEQNGVKIYPPSPPDSAHRTSQLFTPPPQPPPKQQGRGSGHEPLIHGSQNSYQHPSVVPDGSPTYPVNYAPLRPKKSHRTLFGGRK